MKKIFLCAALLTSMMTMAQEPVPTPTPAPTPDFSDKTNMKGVWCDQLTNCPISVEIFQWGQTTEATILEAVYGDQEWYFCNIDSVGLTLQNPVDATGTEYLHIDLYTADMNNIQFTPMSPENVYPSSPWNGGRYQVTLLKNEWNSVDVPLSAFADCDIDWSNIGLFKLMAPSPVGKSIYVDNIYFYSPKNQGTESVSEKVESTKILRNGSLYIRHRGQVYDILGTQTK